MHLKAITHTILFLAGFATLVFGQEPASPPPVLPASEVLIAKVSQGNFSKAIEAAEAEKLKQVLPNMRLRVLSPAEAKEIWSKDNATLELAKGLTSDHYVIALRDTRGKKFEQLVSPEQIPDATRKRIQEGLKRQEHIVKLLDEADRQSGDERLKQLSSVMTLMAPSEFNSVYPDLAAEILKSDAASVKESRDKLRAATNGKDRADKINRLHFDLSMTLRNLPPDATNEKRAEAIDKFIKDKGLEPEFKQLMLMRKYLVWSSAARYPEALVALDEALAVAPASDVAGRIPGFKEAVKKKMSAPVSPKPEVKPAIPPVPPPPAPPEGAPKPQ